MERKMLLTLGMWDFFFSISGEEKTLVCSYIWVKVLFSTLFHLYNNKNNNVIFCSKYSSLQWHYIYTRLRYGSNCLFELSEESDPMQARKEGREEITVVRRPLKKLEKKNKKKRREKRPHTRSQQVQYRRREMGGGNKEMKSYLCVR